jgi:hypothetical protein
MDKSATIGGLSKSQLPDLNSRLFTELLIAQDSGYNC